MRTHQPQTDTADRTLTPAQRVTDTTTLENHSPQAAQLRATQADLQADTPAPIQKMENKTGMPDHLKGNLESMSGFDMSDVRVHYNSDKPAQLQAHAYAQGTDIHIAPGQERHLPHEAWHVVQQKQGRVKPTMQLKGVGVNDDVGLEREADMMGGRMDKDQSSISDELKKNNIAKSSTVQCVFGEYSYKTGSREETHYDEDTIQTKVETWKVQKINKSHLLKYFEDVQKSAFIFHLKNNGDLYSSNDFEYLDPLEIEYKSFCKENGYENIISKTELNGTETTAGFTNEENDKIKTLLTQVKESLDGGLHGSNEVNLAGLYLALKDKLTRSYTSLRSYDKIIDSLEKIKTRTKPKLHKLEQEQKDAKQWNNNNSNRDGVNTTDGVDDIVFKQKRQGIKRRKKEIKSFHNAWKKQKPMLDSARENKQKVLGTLEADNFTSLMQSRAGELSNWTYDHESQESGGYGKDIVIKVSHKGYSIKFVLKENFINDILDRFGNIKPSKELNVSKSDFDALHFTPASGKGSWNVIKPRSNDNEIHYELKMRGIDTERWKPSPATRTGMPNEEKTMEFKKTGEFDEK